jgi:two-component system sensor histidine kinase RegB
VDEKITTLASSAGGFGRVQLRTLALIRWVAIAGQAAALMVVHFGLGYSLPLLPALATVCVSALFNSATAVRRPSGSLGERGVATYLAFDVVQLAVLLFLTGGLQNPFAFLLLAPVAISATVLSLTSTVALCGIALVSITVLGVWHLPLPWKGPSPHLPDMYVLGVWVALAIGIIFFAAYTWRVAEEARRLSEGLTATQLALAREQQLSAMGALAAAAAHELGSPLGTIAVTAREISRDLPAGSPLAEDVELLISETARCRDILADLAHNPAGDNAPFSQVPIGAIVESASALHRNDTVAIAFDAAPSPDAPDSREPRITSAPEIIHGIGNLVQNAVQFARRNVTVRTRWSGEWVEVTILDDGPGFAPQVLERIGEPYISMPSDRRVESGDHMGLGIFIAQTLLNRSGARLRFANDPDGGAKVAVRWDRAILEPPAGAAGKQ